MRNSMGAVLAFLVLLFMPGCGVDGSSQAPAPASGEVVLSGKVQFGAAAAKAHTDPITVSVQSDSSITTTVGDDHTFTLRGLPAGSFTLVFTQNGAPIGTMLFTEVAINQQITVTVQLTGGEVVLIDEDRRGIGHAGIELEGLVENVLELSLTGDSRFVIAGRTVIARPGVTAIRKGTTRKTVEDVKPGVRVHVKGTLVEGSTDVLAYEIKIQEEATPPGGTEQKMTICHIPPGNPDKKKTIEIGVSAWPAHQAHGDTEGPC